MTVKASLQPSVMPVDRDKWFQQLSLSNFINSGYLYCDLQKLKNVKSLLIVGPGQGLDTQILRWKNYEVKTFDIDAKFHPDYIGSVHDLSSFKDNEFDAILVSHVLEHLPVEYLSQALSEIARVGRHALIYLPVAGTHHTQLRFCPGFKDLDLSWFFNWFNYLEKPDGKTPKYCAGQHYWEIGYRGYTAKRIKELFAAHFDLLEAYRNKDWRVSYNFILKSR
ncbi:MAG: methyltransferase domain-containing protein [Lentisphaerota bacterium]